LISAVRTVLSPSSTSASTTAADHIYIQLQSIEEERLGYGMGDVIGIRSSRAAALDDDAATATAAEQQQQQQLEVVQVPYQLLDAMPVH
jgi:hypothetical protein